MTVTKKMNDYTVFLRAIEGVPVLIFLIICVAASVFLKRTSVF
ncbi:hypothetical protein [Methanoregula sp.]|jgi:hypothetical protein|nr:hypothetical protein [Methanoregula sp.]